MIGISTLISNKKMKLKNFVHFKKPLWNFRGVVWRLMPRHGNCQDFWDKTHIIYTSWVIITVTLFWWFLSRLGRRWRSRWGTKTGSEPQTKATLCVCFNSCHLVFIVHLLEAFMSRLHLLVFVWYWGVIRNKEYYKIIIRLNHSIQFIILIWFWTCHCLI